MVCPYCKSAHTTTYYQAELPNILSACPERLLPYVKTYPLEAQICHDCLLGFNSKPLDDTELSFIYDNYLYISPLSGIGVSKYEGMIQDLTHYFSLKDQIVEIGCSEGYLLKQLTNRGYTNLIGIEPGPQAETAKTLPVTILKEYFDSNTFQNEKVDGFYLMHVFEHFNDPFSILRSMKNQLNKEGKIIIEVPDFTGYHHQHLFYYNLPFFIRICKDMSLKIVNYTIEKEALRVVVVHLDNENYPEVTFTEDSPTIMDRAASIDQIFQTKLTQLRNFLRNNQDDVIYWWGAGSASIIYLNQIKDLNIEGLDIVIIDGDPSKWNSFIPGVNLEVHEYRKITNNQVKHLVIASSFYQEIEARLKELGVSIQSSFVIY